MSALVALSLGGFIHGVNNGMLCFVANTVSCTGEAFKIEVLKSFCERWTNSLYHV